MKFKNFAEREMTKKEKAKEKRLKKKYDDSDMKKDMKDRYGEDWETVYYATIRKKAMEQFTAEAMQSFPYKIYNDDEVLIADNLESALEILDGEISEQDLEQIEDMAMSGDINPLLSALDGFGYEIVMNEGHSPHKKGTKKYKAHNLRDFMRFPRGWMGKGCELLRRHQRLRL